MVRNKFYFLSCLAFVLSAVVVSCQQDGDNPYVLWKKYSHKEGAFTFYYLVPPFDRASPVRETADTNVQHGQFNVAPKLVADRYAVISDSGLDARIRVEANWLPNIADIDDLTDEMMDRITEWQTYDPSYQPLFLRYQNYFGDMGRSLVLQTKDHWVKIIYLPHRSGYVRIFAWTSDLSALEDIELLLASFRPGDEDDDESETDDAN